MIMIRGIGLENTYTHTHTHSYTCENLYKSCDVLIYIYIFAMVIGYVKLQHTPKHHKPCPRTVVS